MTTKLFAVAATLALISAGTAQAQSTNRIAGVVREPKPALL